jgi:hypothetical protein
VTNGAVAVDGGARAGRGAKGTALALVVAAVFVPQVVSGVYQGLGRQLPDAFPVLSGLAQWLSIAAWFSLYCREHRVPWVVDMGWFLLAWVVVVPYCILRYEGRHGLGRIALFAFMWVAAWAVNRAVLIWVRVLVSGE